MLQGNLSQQTAEKLSNNIKNSSKGYMPGDKLPNENELSSLLGVSRTTLREAIRILVNDGILTVRRGKGTFVSDSLERLADTTAVSGHEKGNLKVTLRDLFEARIIIEPKAAALAVQRASDAEIEEIMSLGEKVQKYILKDPTGEERIASEAAFHGAIIRAAHNDFLESFIPLLTQTIEKVFAVDENLETIAQDAYKDHIIIMDCLKKRDAQAMESAILIHLHHAAWNESIDFA